MFPVFHPGEVAIVQRMNPGEIVRWNGNPPISNGTEVTVVSGPHPYPTFCHLLAYHVERDGGNYSVCPCALRKRPGPSTGDGWAFVKRLTNWWPGKATEPEKVA